MQGNMVTYSFSAPGTMAADHVFNFVAPIDLQLISVSAVVSNAGSTKIKVGKSTDDDAYLVSSNVGYSGVPVEFKLTDFVDNNYPHILKGTIILLTLDYDGAGGTAGHDPCTVLTFLEG